MREAARDRELRAGFFDWRRHGLAPQGGAGAPAEIGVMDRASYRQNPIAKLLAEDSGDETGLATADAGRGGSRNEPPAGENQGGNEHREYRLEAERQHGEQRSFEHLSRLASEPRLERPG